MSRVFDCRVENSYRAWAVNGEVERVLWNHFNPFNFLVSIQLIYHFLMYTMIRVVTLFWNP
jgi:periodic tryptophan protein 1